MGDGVEFEKTDDGYEETMVEKTKNVEKVRGECITIQKTYKDGGVLRASTEEEHTISVRVVEAGVPLAKVRVGNSMTINMDNFESVKITVDIELPSPVEEIDDCYLAAKRFVDLYLNKEVADVREYRDTKRKSGGE